jgi:disulfide bond formation protein DsbB
MISILRVNFLLSLGAALGSLYFSEILKYPPCVLCWYQRICLYPLVLIFGVGLWYAEENTEERHYIRYAIPFAVLGLVLASYHNLIYYGFISEALTPCTQGISCSSKQLEIFGFITIPFLSLCGFLVILGLTLLDSKKGK